MKKLLLSFTVCALIGSSGFAQNLVNNGGFELPNDSLKHLFITERTNWYSDDATENHNGTEYQTGWEGNYYQFCVNTAGAIYQPIDKITTDSATYNVSYLYSIGWTNDAANDKVYSVVYFSHFAPGNINNRTLIDSIATDVTSLYNNKQLVSASFKLPENATYAGDSLVIEFATRVVNNVNISNNTWTNMDSIVVLKTGIETDGIAWKEFDIAKIVDAPNITGSTDFSAKAKIGWDNEFFYLNLAVIDDSVYTEGTENTWERDNFEIYFDMNNGKLPLYPRGEPGWPTSYDGQPGYWQIRLIPGRTFEELNPSFIGGSQLYQVSNTAYTYTYELTLSLNSLLNGFVPEIGTEIGFDILASDNDNDPYYRDQLSIFATLGTIWCDAAMWGTLAFTENGGFEVIDDVTKPSEVTNLAVLLQNNQALVSWDPATDNIVVEQYIVYVNDEEYARVYAKDTNNSIVVSDIDNTLGEYKFGVAAIDLAGNMSDITSFTYVAVNNTTVSKLNIYPNPSSSVISFNNESRVTLQLFNAAGQLISLKAVNAGEKVDVSELTIGVYTVRLIDNNNISVLKLIKK